MLNFQTVSLDVFLSQYWQKKPLLIRQALTLVNNPLSADELAGLALEEEIESRMVIQHPGKSPDWVLKTGPFKEKDFKKLPKSHWTLLVQGVDRFIPEVASLLDHFNFIPQWRVDDVMVSFAAEQGGVGPHYDNYDVFLYQAQGRRKWLLTTQGCVPSNYLEGLDLRIMKEFKVEEEIILEQGDMLYLPPHVGHNGISLSNDCMTYSFGYRSYQAQELWDSFGDYVSAQMKKDSYYQDPCWDGLKNTSKIPDTAWQQAQDLMQKMLLDEESLRDWFACFATSLDGQAEALLPVDDENTVSMPEFMAKVLNAKILVRNTVCRFAYTKSSAGISLYINGCKWCTDRVSETLIEDLANNRAVLVENICAYLSEEANKLFLYALFKLQWIELQ